MYCTGVSDFVLTDAYDLDKDGDTTLIDKYPDSTYADEARKIKEKVQRYRAGKKPRGRSPSEKP